jgi:hypothetical protein
MFPLQTFAQLAEEGLYFIGCGRQMRCRPPRRRRRIIQFVRQASRHRAQRNQFFPLLRIAFKIAHFGRGRVKNLTSHRAARRQHAPELLLIESE